MPPVHPFRTSLYLSLALAVASVGVAGGDLLPEIPYVTAFCLLLLGAAYTVEGRWQLSLRDANLVGLGLVGLLGLWAVFQAVRPPTGLSDTLPWPASALPYLAPVLMLLIPAKLFRPKHVGDYWAMHGLGMLAMALACAMASDGLFILMFAAYAAAFVWSLTSFHLYRELGPVKANGARLAGGRFRALGPAARWAALTGAMAVPLFWATPRTGSQWELGINSRGRASTGISDGPVDLNTTGPVSVNREKAFEFFVEDPAGNPVLDFPADARFRVTHLQFYQDGRWGRNQFTTLQTADRAISPTGSNRDPGRRLPHLGPGTVYLSFTLDSRLTRTPPLADPVAWRHGELSPAASKWDDGTYRLWVHRHDGTLDGAFSFDSGAPQYTQAWAPPPGPGLAPVMRVQPSQTAYLAMTSRNPPRVRAFTDQLVERLVAAGKLPKEALARPDGDARARLPEHHETIARALERHLAQSGEYTYTLDLARQDREIDPIEDFLINTRSGHCQRFATALVLMLRTQGIPAQMVVGYRGSESRGDGWYDVREDHAHAWAEILVPAPGAEAVPVYQIGPTIGYPADLIRGVGFTAGGPALAAFPLPLGWEPMRWVTLDPTPAGELAATTEDDSLLSQARQWWNAVLKALLLAYNKDSREAAAAAVEEWVTHDNGAYYLLAGAAALVGLWWLRRRLARPSGPRPLGPDYFRRLTTVLTKAGHPWLPGRTAREYAAGVADVLRADPATEAVADVPRRVVAAYYAERFGEQPLGSDDRQALSSDLRRLELALS
jgi:hypothetical protein